MIERLWVFDTNVLVGRMLNPGGIPAQAVDAGLDTGVMLLSDATYAELAEVLMRPKFDPYLSATDRHRLLEATATVSRRVPVTRTVRACRDPRDDKFLEVALSGPAHALVSGDADLLALHPYLGLPILSPRDFLSAVHAATGAAGPLPRGLA
jgi:putative PIN family toxin of toxin-antitoxin system